MNVSTPSQQQPLDDRVRWSRKPLYWLLFTVPSLPLIIFLIPDGMTLMPEPTDPWYTRYTAPIWLLTAFYVYPATALGTLLGVPPGSPGWVLIVLLYRVDRLGHLLVGGAPAGCNSGR